MRKVYIAHPLRGERLDIAVIERNVARVTEICRRAAEEHPNVLLLSPIHAFDFISPLGPQEWVLAQCRALLDVADELWVFGDWERSEGCCMEVAHARGTGKLILFEDGRVEGGQYERDAVEGAP